MKKNYYAISGKMGSGKTTVAEGLVPLFGFRRRGFADAIKESVAQALACPVADVYAQKQVFRSSLQALGQAGRAYWGEDYWIRKTLAWFEDAESDVPNDERDQLRFVLDDLRFPNEAAALKEFGFRLVRIEDDPRWHRKWCEGQGYNQGQQQHISETALDGYEEWDIVLSGRPTGILSVFAEFLVKAGLVPDINIAYRLAGEYLGAT